MHAELMATIFGGRNFFRHNINAGGTIGNNAEARAAARLQRARCLQRRDYDYQSQYTEQRHLKAAHSRSPTDLGVSSVQHSL